MNREIKFRAWNRHLGRMLKDEFYVAHDGDVYQHESHPDHDLEVVDELILMQFTGLHDKNGKEIYEGDLLRWRDDRLVEVKFEDCLWSAGGWSLKDYDKRKLEIIGNIYENPELLTK